MSDDPERLYPILTCYRGSTGSLLLVPWSVVAQHEQQAERNHGQTLERLAERGGLAPAELLAVLEDRPWRKMDRHEAIAAVRAFVAKAQASRT